MMNDVYRRFLMEGQQAGLRYGIGSPRSLQRGLVGSQLGSRAGSSLEFMDHREYIPGDDLRRIDWNAFARSDKLSIKLYRDEVSPHVDIIIDCSISMALEQTQKARATLGLAAAFAQAAANSNYTFTTWAITDICAKIPNGSDNPVLWEGLDFESNVNCQQALQRYLPAWRARGIRFLISDLLWMGDPHSVTAVLADSAAAVFVIQVLADIDANPPQRGNIRLFDCETQDVKDIFVDAVSQKRYLKNLASHQYNWNRSCRQFGAVMTSVLAEETVERWNLEKLVLAEILKIL